MVLIDDAFYPLLIGLIAGSGFGALSAFMGYIKNRATTEFDNLKFIYGIVTGIFTGLGAALLLQQQLMSAQTASALLAIIAEIGVSVVAVDTIRTVVTGSIHSTEAEIRTVKTG